MRKSILILFLSLLCLPAQAAECSAPMRERWSSTIGEVLDIARQLMRARDMGEAYDMAGICRAKKRMPTLVATANEYFPACDPMSAPRELAGIQRLETTMARFDCSKFQEVSESRKKK
ncbi:hypothetical protein [Microvirga flavescens]|uniref:hypothetical protein n=1 Tax=Microvirga flavescens TaxID=2249811 RepID=UPI000DD999B2|nr:hypothetical protein [Microvirga flavescens]